MLAIQRHDPRIFFSLTGAKRHEMGDQEAATKMVNSWEKGADEVNVLPETKQISSGYTQCNVSSAGTKVSNCCF